MLYQLSHFRSIAPPPVGGAESQIRTGDTAIFSRVLYRLSYLGPAADRARPPVGDREDTTGPSSRATPGGRTASRPPVRYSSPSSGAASEPESGFSPESWRSRLIRSTIGGCVEKSADVSPSFLLGFAK